MINFREGALFAQHPPPPSVKQAEIRKTQIFMNKRVYVGVSILELSKIVMYEFWYDYVKPKFGVKAKLCCMETKRCSIYIKADDISKDIAKDVEKLYFKLWITQTITKRK